MLLYNKALDTNHTLLRMITLLLSWRTETVENEALRLFDFLVANPAHIQKLSVPKGQLEEKKYFKDYRNRYQSFEPKSLFNAMQEVHFVVIERLLDIGVLQLEKESPKYQVVLSKIPDELKTLAESKENSISNQAIEFIVTNLTPIAVTGPNGLKKITNLMDFKYDVN